MNKLSKAAVNYRPTHANVARKCGTCSMFRPQSASCTLVQGPIRASDVCDRWKAAQGGTG